VNTGLWIKDETPRKTWYEIIVEENNFLREVLLKEKPRDILEIGCGAGRVIRFALELEKREGPKTGWRLTSLEAYEQNRDICLTLKDQFRTESRVAIHRGLVGKNSKTDRFNPIWNEHKDRFDMVLAVSNLVGWQENEKEWITELLKAGKSLFFTIYKKGYELERARMYQASGDIITFREDGNIELIVDAFQDEKQVTKAYNEAEIERIINCVASEVPLKKIERFDGKYMVGYLLKKE
jgi:SAM-dependent methyltransferase